MRILTVCSGLELGGTERAAQEFTLGYQEAGHQVAVLNRGLSGPRQTTLEEHGVPVFTANGNLDRALKAADHFNPDIIHIHRRGWRDDTETYILRHLRTRDRRVLEQNVFGSVDDSPAAHLIDVHLHLSKWCLWRWSRLLGKGSAMHAGVIVPNPVDPNRFKPADAHEIEAFLQAHGIEHGAYTCGRVGQPLPGKWHAQTLHAFSDLAKREPRAYLLLVGMPESLRDVLTSLPAHVQRRVIQMPLTADDDTLRVIYSSLDCFIHAANQGESFGMVLAEAMLCGCPVATVSQPHKDNSQVEVVGHMQGGVVAGTMNELSAAVQHLWHDAELRKELSRKCRSRILARFDAGAVVRTALRVAEIALAANDRMTLLRNLVEEEGLSTAVDDREIVSLLENTLGNPSSQEKFRMSLMHNPFVDRARRRVRHLLKGDK